MSEKSDELLKRPLYVFDLPHELLVTLHLKDTTSQLPLSISAPPPDTSKDQSEGNGAAVKSSTACQLCRTSFQTVQEQRQHVKSDWHNYNLKQKVREGNSVTEIEFEKLIDELDESISGSGSESTGSEGEGEGLKESTLTALLKKQARLHDDGQEGEGETFGRRRNRGSGKPPLLWFSSPLLPAITSLGIYRALFTNSELEEPDVVGVLRKKQSPPVPAKPQIGDASNGVPLPSTMTSPSIFMCMIGGGHFAGMVVSLAPKLGKQSSGTEQRQAIVLAHKTFHRYTTRRKQGGAQSANDSAKGAAHSAGSSLRRYNEVALEQEIRALLSEWKSLISASQLIFVRATGSSNRRILFGPYENQILSHKDPRNRSFPFSTRRATQAELMRAFVELTRLKISHIDESALADTTKLPNTPRQPTLQPSKPATPSITKDEETATHHTTQLQTLIRRTKASALLTYLSTNSLSPNYTFHPSSHHAPTPLHLAASTNSPAIVLALLTKAGADPRPRNQQGSTAFELAGDRATRDAFRVAREEVGEEKWDWDSAAVPAALTKAQSDDRRRLEREEEGKREGERRRREEERLMREGPVVKSDVGGGGSVLGGLGVRKTAEERREEEGRGMSEEMRRRVERERRARAVEARLGLR